MRGTTVFEVKQYPLYELKDIQMNNLAYNHLYITKNKYCGSSNVNTQRSDGVY